jgi:hypothetical protein
MQSIYKTQHLAGVGSALIIICDGQRDHVRFAEHHIVLPHSTCKRISKRLLTDVSRNVVTDDELRGHALNLATARVQSEADESVRYSIGEHHIASAVVATLADEKDIRALRYAGVCTEELAEIARVTLNDELRQLMRIVCSLPVISVEDL